METRQCFLLDYNPITVTWECLKPWISLLLLTLTAEPSPLACSLSQYWFDNTCSFLTKALKSTLKALRNTRHKHVGWWSWHASHKRVMLPGTPKLQNLNYRRHAYLIWRHIYGNMPPLETWWSRGPPVENVSTGDISWQDPRYSMCPQDIR
jgi:hypothetical protein